MELDREKFIRVYANIPDSLRADIIVVVDKQPYTWETAYFEVKESTKLSEKILKTLKEIGII